MNADEFTAMAAMKAATDPNLLTLKAALRERFGETEAQLLSRCIDNAYGHGFTCGAIDATERAITINKAGA